MTADLDAVLATYLRIDPTHTLDAPLDQTWLAHAAYMVANAGLHDANGWPTTPFLDRIAATHALLERISPELGSAVVDGGAMVRHG